MYEIELMNNVTHEIIFAYGFSIKEVFKKENLDSHEWSVIDTEYID